MKERMGVAYSIERMAQESARERKERNELWCKLVSKRGTLVEDIIAPSIRRLAPEVFDCGELRRFATLSFVNRSDDLSRERRFEALYVGSRAVLLNETNALPRTEDVQEFVEFVESGEFALYHPWYAQMPVRPVFSSLSIPEDLVRSLTRHGIYAIAMGDEEMQVLNLDAVRNRRSAP